MKRTARVAGLALGLVLFWRLGVSAEVTGPVVGFVRVEVGMGPQHIEPTVRPFTPNEDETKAEMLTDYLGDEFIAASDAIEADWVGVAVTDNGADEVTMMWRDQDGQWRDLQGNETDPECENAHEFWLDLFFEANRPTETRELVLAGQVVW